MRPTTFFAAAALLVAGITGCGGSSSADFDATTVTPTSVDGSKYLLAEEPDGAVGVIAARESANDGDSIVVVGRIGGAANPWIQGRAAFMLLDASMVLVANGTESGEKEICMDDCCSTERAASTTLVKVVDADGSILAADARQLWKVSADDMVVVRGKVSKDAHGNFVLLADGLHIRN